ncbi:hypothetical protein ABW19_dt0208737 [Dactylella cylindrospora]|nr:hypothetical protein ABW19_dt0208737 [Dactylella cylindrospora]
MVDTSIVTPPRLCRPSAKFDHSDLPNIRPLDSVVKDNIQYGREHVILSSIGSNTTTSSTRIRDVLSKHVCPTLPYKLERGLVNGLDDLYEKKIISASEQGQGSLRKLFNFDGMRAAPQQNVRGSPVVSRAVSPAPVITSISRTSSPTPGERTKLKSAWTDIY